MIKINRVILIVMDGCGAGAAPDAGEYGDYGVELGNTLVNLCSAVGGVKLPTLRRLGLGNLLPLKGVEPVANPIGNYGKLTPQSKGGKDTVSGHWEMMGIVLNEKFPTYPNGFPPEVVDAFSRAVGREVIGNYPASGTEIIKQMGMEHIQTGKPIVYTSADSVFQIAANEEIISIDLLYEMCRIARKLLVPPHGVQRVIARPFAGNSPDTFYRTERRKDFPVEPPYNVLDALNENNIKTYGIGVVPETFNNRGFAAAVRTQTNEAHYHETLKAMETSYDFIFANFEDFDMKYGHRNDPEGFAKALETFDGYVSVIMDKMNGDDLLMLTADHGNDPTTPSTDHTREYVPILLYSKILEGGISYGIRESFADIGATLMNLFSIPSKGIGSSLV